MSSDGAETITDSASEGTGHGRGIRLNQDPPFWTSSQLRALHPFKEEWFLATSESKKDVLQRALKELAVVAPEVDEDSLKPKVINWLKRRVKSRTKWGPGGKVPSLRTILYWYRGDYFTKLVEDRYPPEPGETQPTKPNVGAMSAVVAEYMRRLETDPAMAEEKQKYEKLRLDWAKNGAPKDRRQKMATKKASSMISKFALELYCTTGMRIVVLGGHKNEYKQVLYGCYDFNKELGKNAKKKFEETYPEWEDVMGAFRKYCQENISGDEGEGDGSSNSDSDDEGEVAIRKGLRQKPKVDLKKNAYGEPQLPKDCLQTAGDKNKDLDRKKDILRCWLTAYYNLAKASRAARVPWKKITDQPDEFYDSGFMPPDILIRDPSKMVKEQIEACFRLWKKKEAKGKRPFQFRQVYSSQRGFQAGRGRRIIDSETDDEDADTGSRKPADGYRYEPPKSPSPIVSNSDESDAEETSHAKKGKGRARMEEENTDGDDEKEDDDDDAPPKKRPRKRTQERKKKKPQRARKEPEHSVEGQQDQQMDPNIDPILQSGLQMFPTNGPNDSVPPGFIPTPVEMAPKFVNLARPPVQKSGAKGKAAKKAAPAAVAPLTRSQKKLQNEAAAAKCGRNRGNESQKRKRSAHDDPGDGTDENSTEEAPKGRKRKRLDTNTTTTLRKKPGPKHKVGQSREPSDTVGTMVKKARDVKPKPVPGPRLLRGKGNAGKNNNGDSFDLSNRRGRR